MLSHLLTRLNPSYSEKILLTISYLTHLDMGLGKSSMDYMSRIRSISHQIQWFVIDKIIPLFSIASLDCDRYPGLKIRYLTGDPAQVNCNLLDLSGILSRKNPRLQALGLPISTPPSMVNRVSEAQAQPPLMGRPQPRPIHPPPTTSPTD